MFTPRTFMRVLDFASVAPVSVATLVRSNPGHDDERARAKPPEFDFASASPSGAARDLADSRWPLRPCVLDPCCRGDLGRARRVHRQTVRPPHPAWRAP